MTLPTLDAWPIGDPARIAVVAWDAMDHGEARRLRELGLIEGVELTVLHRGSLFARDPLAVLVGRMRLILRAAQARHVQLVPGTAPEPWA